MRILCFGNLIIDHVYQIEPTRVVADKWIVGTPVRHIGGQAFNVARALSHLGHDVSFAGVVGPQEDRKTRAEITTTGVDLSLADPMSALWRQAHIYVDPASGARKIYMQTGKPAAVPNRALKAVVQGAFDAIYLDGYDREAALALSTLGARQRLPIFADFEFADPMGRPFYESCSHVLFSAAALRAQTGLSDLSQALVMAGGADRVVTALDGQGPILALCPRTGAQHLMPREVTPTDTTGAGDNFRAGYVHATLSGQPLAAALRFARDIGAEACRHPGPSIPADRIRDTPSCSAPKERFYV